MKDELLARDERGWTIIRLWSIGREGIAVSLPLPAHARLLCRADLRSKVHFLIVSLLNAAFPDHDFSALRPDQFTRERSAAQVLASLTSNFATSTGNTAPYGFPIPILQSVLTSPDKSSPKLPCPHL